MAATHRRAAAEIYWNIRSSSPSVRQYLVLFFRGNRQAQLWNDIYGAGQSVDLALEEVKEGEELTLHAGVRRAPGQSDHHQRRERGVNATLRRPSAREGRVVSHEHERGEW